MPLLDFYHVSRLSSKSAESEALSNSSSSNLDICLFVFWQVGYCYYETKQIYSYFKFYGLAVNEAK